MRSLLITGVFLLSATTASCALPEEVGSGGGGGGASSECGGCTSEQEQAFGSAQDYLDLGSGFSRDGLIQQLSSQAGDGYKRKDATVAVDKLAPNYNKQAVLSARAYLDISNFSKAGLIEQLTSKAGDGYTRQQATQAVDKVLK